MRSVALAALETYRSAETRNSVRRSERSGDDDCDCHELDIGGGYVGGKTESGVVFLPHNNPSVDALLGTSKRDCGG